MGISKVGARRLSTVSLGLLSIIGLVFSVLLPFLSPLNPSFESSWNPSPDYQQTRLVRAVPDQIEVTVSCQVFSEVRNGSSLLISDTWRLRAQDWSVSLESDAWQSKARVALCEESFVVIVDNEEGQLRLDDGSGNLVSERLPELLHFARYRVPAASLALVYSIDVSSSGLTLIQGQLRALVLSLALATWVLFSLVLISSAGSYKPRRESSQRDRLRKPITSWDWILLAAMVIAGLTITSKFDEGWIFWRSQFGLKTGANLEYFWPASPITFQGSAWEDVIGQVFAAGEIAAGRMFTTLLSFAAWLLAKGVIARVYSSRGEGIVAFGRAFFFAFFVANLATVRPEPLVAFLVVLVIVSAIQAARSFSPLWFHLGVAAAITAFATHQTAVLLLGPVAATVFYSFFSAKRTRNELLILWASLVSNATLALALVFWKLDLDRLLFEIRVWLQRDGYSASELERWWSLFGGPAWLWWPWLIFFFATVLVAFNFQSLRLEQNRVLFLSASSIIGLLLTTSKWQWHLAAAAAPATLVVAAAAYVIARKVDFGKTREIALSVGIFGFLVSFLISQGSQLDGFDWGFRFHSKGILEPFANKELAAVTLLGVSIGLFWWVVNYRKTVSVDSASLRKIVALPLTLSIMVPGLIYISSQLLDSTYFRGWTFLRQNLSLSNGPYSCGLDEEGIAINSYTPIGSGDRYHAITVGQGLRYSSLSGDGVSIPIFKNDAGRVAFWVRATTSGNFELDEPLPVVRVEGVEVANISLEDGRYELSLMPNVWRLVTFEAPEKSMTLVKVRVSEPHSDFDFDITEMVEPHLVSWRTLSQNGSLLASPAVVNYLPCWNLNGIEPPFLEQPTHGIATGDSVVIRSDAVAGSWWEVGALESRGSRLVRLYQLVRD